MNVCNFFFRSIFPFLIFVFIFPTNVFAQYQTNASATTKVGNPKTSPPGGNDTGGGGGGIPAPPVPGDIKQAIRNTFGITMNSFDDQHLQWAWEKFWDISDTQFIDLIRGAVVTGLQGDSQSMQNGCPPNETVRLGQYRNREYFKFILTHELGHSIQICKTHVQSRYEEHKNAFAAERGVSFYANNSVSCSGSRNVTNLNEDYADTIAYFLNPSAGLASGGCPNLGEPQSPPNPFFVENRHPLHYTVAKGILGR